MNDSEKLDNCSERPLPLPDRAGAPSGNVNFHVGLQCSSSRGMTHMFAWDWKQSTEKILDPMVCGLQRVSVCLSANKLGPCDTPLLRPFSAPGLTCRPPSWGNMKVSYFPPLRKQYRVHHNIKQLFHPTPHPSEQSVPLAECSGLMLSDRETGVCHNLISVNSGGVLKVSEPHFSEHY